MNFNKYEIESLNNAIKSYLNNYGLANQAEPMPFDFKKFVHTNKSASTPVNLDYDKMQEDFVKELAVIYVKTFYNKSPYEFSEIHYRNHCYKFNKHINSSENKDRIVSTIKKMLSGEEFSLEELDEDIFKDILKASLNSTEPFNPLLPNRIIPEVILYINPDAEDYSHLLLFLAKNMAAQSINLNVETRNTKDGHLSKPDSLELRMFSKDLPKVIEILERYQELYPNNVGKFGATYEFLGRTKADWFSYVYASQNIGDKDNTISGIYELNILMNNYVLPIIVLRDLWGINSFITDEEYTDVFLAMFNKAVGEDFFKYFKIFRNDKYISQMADAVENLDYLKKRSLMATEENYLLKKDLMRALTPEQFRRRTQKKDTDFLLNEGIIINFVKFYKGYGLSSSFKRDMFEKFISKEEIREAMRKYYLFDGSSKDSENLTNISIQVLELLKEYAENTTYLSPDRPYLSKKMVEDLEEYQVNSVDITQSLNLIEPLYLDKDALIGLLKEINQNEQGDKGKNLTEKKLIETYIETVGLDNIIYAFNVLKKYGALEQVKNISHDRDHFIFDMRKKRGRKLYEDLSKLSKEDRADYTLYYVGDYEIEDYRSYRDFTSKEEMDKTND